MLYAERDSDNDLVIKIAPEALEIPFVKDVYKNDKHSDKIFFNKVIKWVFHVYSRDHVFSALSLSERKKNVVEVYFDGKAPRWGMENIEHNKRVQEFIAGYNRLTKTVTERLVEKLDDLIDKEQERMATINMYKETPVEIPYEFSVDLKNLYEKVDDEFVKIKPRVVSGKYSKKIQLYDSQILSDMVSRSFKTIETYEEAKRKSFKERYDLIREFSGESWLERYYRLKDSNKI